MIKFVKRKLIYSVNETILINLKITQASVISLSQALII